jgi:hypothetical protein
MNLLNVSSRAEKVFEEMKLTYNANHCHMLQINSSVEKITDVTLLKYWKNVREEENVEVSSASSGYKSTLLQKRYFSIPRFALQEQFADDDAAKWADESPKCLVNSDVLLHPLSPELESQRMFNSSLKVFPSYHDSLYKV